MKIQASDASSRKFLDVPFFQAWINKFSDTSNKRKPIKFIVRKTMQFPVVHTSYIKQI
jgi:competence transcription factor ComK